MPLWNDVASYFQNNFNRLILNQYSTCPSSTKPHTSTAPSAAWASSPKRTSPRESSGGSSTTARRESPVKTHPIFPTSSSTKNQPTSWSKASPRNRFSRPLSTPCTTLTERCCFPFEMGQEWWIIPSSPTARWSITRKKGWNCWRASLYGTSRPARRSWRTTVSSPSYRTIGQRPSWGSTCPQDWSSRLSSASRK